MNTLNLHFARSTLVLMCWVSPHLIGYGLAADVSDPVPKTPPEAMGLLDADDDILPPGIKIEFQFSSRTVPGKMSDEAIEVEVEAEVDRFRRSMEVADSKPGASNNAAAVEALRESARRRYTSGSEFGFRGTLFVGEGYYAIRTGDNQWFGGEMWEARIGKDYYHLVADSRKAHVSISDKSRGGTTDCIEIVLSAYGGPKWVLNESWMASGLHNGRVERMEGGYGIVGETGRIDVITGLSGKPLLRLFELENPYGAYRIEYHDHRRFDKVILPMKMVSTITDSRSTSIKEVETLGVDSIDAGEGIPFISLELPKCWVTDERFDPPLRYTAKGKLATDEQIAEWVNDPKALEAHEKAMSRIP